MNNSTDPNPSTATSNNCSRLTAVINAASVDCCAQEFEFGEPFVIQDGKVLYIMTNAVKGYFLSLLLKIFSWWCLKTSLSPKTWSLVRLKRLPSQLTGEIFFVILYCHWLCSASCSYWASPPTPSPSTSWSGKLQWNIAKTHWHWQSTFQSWMSPLKHQTTINSPKSWIEKVICPGRCWATKANPGWRCSSSTSLSPTSSSSSSRFSQDPLLCNKSLFWNFRWSFAKLYLYSSVQKILFMCLP